VTSSWFFLSTLNYDARSTTHQNCKNIKRKAPLCNGNIHVNQECQETNVTSCFAIPKIPLNTQASKFNELETQKILNTDEIKLLYAQNQNLNQQVYQLYTFLANIWNLLPSDIGKSIQLKIHRIKRYKAVIMIKFLRYRYGPSYMR